MTIANTIRIEEIKEKTIQSFRNYPADKAILFGSYAKGEANDKSDVDYSDSINNSIACVFN
ncbi:hypothetical protein C3E89_10650 [Clostridium sp. Cult1]|nr:hypothetical protein [Clostridium sp. Cult1]